MFNLRNDDPDPDEANLESGELNDSGSSENKDFDQSKINHDQNDQSIIASSKSFVGLKFAQLKGWNMDIFYYDEP